MKIKVSTMNSKEIAKLIWNAIRLWIFVVVAVLDACVHGFLVFSVVLVRIQRGKERGGRGGILKISHFVMCTKQQ